MKHFSLFIVALLLSTPVGSLYAQHLMILSASARPATGSQSPHLADDDIRIDSAHTHRVIVPRQATIRSLLVLGLGQIYNRQYWKLPIIYGGIGAAIYFFNWNQKRYSHYVAGYREAYLSTMRGAKTAIVEGRILSVQQLKQASDQFLQQRDLTIILTVAGWALQVMDANVAAHLKTFDLSDDLSIQVIPVVMPMVPTMGIVPGIRVVLNVKR